MAKRRPQSNANDTSAGQVPARSKPRRSSGERRSLVSSPSDAAGLAAAQPTEEEIRYRAYFRYLERGASEGDAFDDWLHAERELKKN